MARSTAEPEMSFADPVEAAKREAYTQARLEAAVEQYDSLRERLRPVLLRAVQAQVADAAADYIAAKQASDAANR